MAITKVTSGLISADASSIDLNIDAGTLYLDVSENKVGIGNTSPLGKLTISNAAGANAPTTVTAANTYLQLGSDDYGASNNGKFMIGFGYTDATNTNSPAYIGYEETSTSGDTKGELTFYTRDVITDTAPSERMRIDTSGDILMGIASSGGYKLQVAGDNPNRGIFQQIYNYGGSPRSGSQLLFTQAGVGNWAIGQVPNTNAFAIYDGRDASSDGTERMRIDSSGNVGITAAASIRFNGAGDNTHAVGYDSVIDGSFMRGQSGMRFLTGTGTGSERMRIDSSGSVGFGTTSADPDADSLFILATDNYALYSGSNGTGTSNHMVFGNGNSWVGSITTNGSTTTYNTSSDYRLKENVDYEFNALDRVAQLKPARFNFIANADITVDGFLAHEVQDIVPEAVAGEKDAVDDEGNPDYQGIDHSKLVPLLTKAIQEQQTIIDNLTTRIETLENA